MIYILMVHYVDNDEVIGIYDNYDILISEYNKIKENDFGVDQYFTYNLIKMNNSYIDLWKKQMKLGV